MLYHSRLIDNDDLLLESLKNKAAEIKKELDKIPNPSQDIKTLESKVNSFYRKLGATSSYYLPGRSEKDAAKGDALFKQFSTQIDIIESEISRLRSTLGAPREKLVDKISQIKRIINKIIQRNARRKGIEPFTEFSNNTSKYQL